MSKIGKKTIIIPANVQLELGENLVNVKGPKGQQVVTLLPQVKVEAQGGELRVSVTNPSERKQRALWGTFRSLIQNALIGVSAGFEKKLEVVGVGYKVALVANKLVLNLGYSHTIEMDIPKGLEVKVEKNVIIVSGSGKQEVGEFAALIRARRKPEPYKGKGIRYQDEQIRRKAGKVVKAVGS